LRSQAASSGWHLSVPNRGLKCSIPFRTMIYIEPSSGACTLGAAVEVHDDDSIGLPPSFYCTES
jgi:hypothetical protein